MITLLIWILILMLVFGFAVYIVQTMGLAQPMANIVLAIVGLIFLLIILGMVLPPPWHYGPLLR